MINLNKKTILYLTYALAVLSVILYLNLTALDNYLVVGIAMIAVMLPIFFLDLKYALPLLIIIRPIIDAYSNYQVISIQGLSLNVNSVLGLTVFAWGIFYIIFKKIDLKKIPGIWLIAGFFLLSIISTIFSSAKVDSIAEIIKLSNIFIFYILAFYLVQQNNKFINKLIGAISIGAIIPVALAIIQFITQAGLTFGELSNRVYGTFGHPNVLGFYLVLAISVLLLKFLNTKPEKRHPLILISLIILFSVLLLTYTRGAWIGLGIFLLLIGILQYRKPLILGAAGVCLFLLFAQGINFVLVSNTDYDMRNIPLISRFTSRSEEADSINWRFEVLSDMAPKVLESPVIGHGPGTFPMIRKQQDIGFFEDLEAHNDYLRIAVEMGLLGLLTYVLLIITLFTKAFKKYLISSNRRRQLQLSPSARIMALGAMSIMAAFFAMSISDNMLQHTAVMWAFWAVLGGMMAVRE